MTPLINMEEVVRLANKGLHKDYPAFVSMSGGNTATIYVGPQYVIDDEGDRCDPGLPDVAGDYDDEFWTVLAGPGVYRPGPPEAYPEEFSVGWDQDLCDNEPDPVRLIDPHPCLTREMRAALQIVDAWRKHPVVKSWGLV